MRSSFLYPLIFPSLLLVGCLKSSFSPNDIHYLPYQICRLFFESLNLSNVNTIELLLPLLSISKLYLQFTYSDARLTTKQCQAIVARYMDNKKSHQIVLPVEMLNKNADCLDAVRPRWAQYEPKVISITHPSAFTEEEQRDLLARLGPHPEGCASIDTAIFGLSNTAFVNNWEVTADLWGDLHVWKSPSVIFRLIDEHFYEGCHLDPRILCLGNDFSDSNQATEAIWADVKQSYGSSQYTTDLFNELQRATDHMSRRRQILWKTKLTHVLISMLLDGYVSGLSEEHLTRASILLYNVIEQHDLKDVPEYILVSMLHQMSLYYCDNALAIDSKLQELQHKLDLNFCLGGSFETRLLAWRKLMWYLVRPTESFYAGTPITVEQVLYWWGDFDNLAYVLYQNPRFDSPWAIVITSATQSPHVTMIDGIPKLLDLINPILQRRATAMNLLNFSAVKEELTEEEELICRCIARSIAANIMYNGALGLVREEVDGKGPLQWPWSTIPKTNRNLCPLNIRTYLHDHTHIHEYIEYEMLLEAKEELVNDADGLCDEHNDAF